MTSRVQSDGHSDLDARAEVASGAVVLGATNSTQRVSVGSHDLNVHLWKDRRMSDVAPQGIALIIAEGDGRYTFAGNDVGFGLRLVRAGWPWPHAGRHGDCATAAMIRKH